MHETHDKENFGASSGADAAFDRHVRLREHNSRQLERRIAFRRATKMAMRNAMSPRRGSG